MSRRMGTRTTEEMGSRDSANMARRLQYALRHPDCPEQLLDMEASRLARFLAIRYYKVPGVDE